jgi:hypothetical protein
MVFWFRADLWQASMAFQLRGTIVANRISGKTMTRSAFFLMHPVTAHHGPVRRAPLEPLGSMWNEYCFHRPVS